MTSPRMSCRSLEPSAKENQVMVDWLIDWLIETKAQMTSERGQEYPIIQTQLRLFCLILQGNSDFSNHLRKSKVFRIFEVSKKWWFYWKLLMTNNRTLLYNSIHLSYLVCSERPTFKYHVLNFVFHLRLSDGIYFRYYLCQVSRIQMMTWTRYVNY